MISLTVLILTILVLQIKTETVKLDHNQFILYNKFYHKAKLSQTGTGFKDIGTYEFELKPNQLWTFDPHPTKKGCYYIVNEYYPKLRLADNKQNFGAYSGPYYDDQLFKVVPSGKNDGFFYLYSCYYEKDRIAKYSSKDNDIGIYTGAQYPDQLWRLVPRFKANIYTDMVFHFDNRQGSTDITREVSVTTGIVRSSSSEVHSSTSFSASVEASMEVAVGIFNLGASVSTEFSTGLEKSFSESEETSWSKTETITFTIPAGKNYKVMQHSVDFDGVFKDDDCSLLTSIKIFESDSGAFDDPDDFIISHVQS